MFWTLGHQKLSVTKSGINFSTHLNLFLICIKKCGSLRTYMKRPEDWALESSRDSCALTFCIINWHKNVRVIQLWFKLLLNCLSRTLKRWKLHFFSLLEWWQHDMACSGLLQRQACCFGSQTIFFNQVKLVLREWEIGYDKKKTLSIVKG